MRRCFFMPMIGMMPPATPYGNSHCHGPDAGWQPTPAHLAPFARHRAHTQRDLARAGHHRHVRAERGGKAGRAARGVVAVYRDVVDPDHPGNVHRLFVAGVLEHRVDVADRQTGVGDRGARGLDGERPPVNAFIPENLRVTDTNNG